MAEKKTKKAKKVELIDRVKQVEKFVKELFDLIGTKALFSVEEDKENDTIMVNIETETDRGLLIGRHGDNIFALQSVIALALKQKNDEWTRVVVNVGDWRNKQEERLLDLANQTAARVKATGESQSLYNLLPAERRIVHLELAKDPEIVSESQGEGRDRFMVVSLKK